MYELRLKHHFDSAHRLLDYKGQCANLHGHRWVVKVVIKTDKLIDNMVADFKDIKRVIDKLDHSYLNDLIDFNPTAENISKYLHQVIYEVVPKSGKGIENREIDVEVTLWESPEASITYK